MEITQITKQEWDRENTPLVSVSCITFNHEDYIRDTLEGFFVQRTKFQVELLIHDDASIDRTADIIREYHEKYPKLIFPILQKLNQKSQGNKPGLFNYNRAKGKYIAICEGDDYWTDPFKLQKQVDELEKHPQCQICFHPAYKLNDKTGERTVVSKHYSRNKVIDVSEVIKGDGGFCPTASLMFKREVINNMPSFINDAPVGDYFLQVLGAVKGGAFYINDCMSVYRVGTGVSWSDGLKDREAQLKQYDRFHKSLDELDRYLNNKYHNEFEQLKANRFYYLSISFLKQKHFSEFREFIELGYRIKSVKSMENKFVFYLRRSPRLLYYMTRLKKKLVF